MLIVGLIGGRRIALWSYLVAFSAAVLGAMAYFLRANEFVARLLPEGHKYEQLLAICLVVLAVGFSAVLVGTRRTHGVASLERG